MEECFEFFVRRKLILSDKLIKEFVKVRLNDVELIG